MRTNYRINSGVRFQMISEDQLQELFEGVLQILAYTGLEVQHEEAGAPVDAEFAKRIGADGYGSNSPAAVDLASQLFGTA
jgi:methanogenic corrinoid protein MtbC1